MKKLFVGAIILCTSLYSAAQKNETVTGNFKKLQWLIGEWNRTNARPGRSGLEKWVINSATEMQGWGITMKEKDTLLVEKAKLLVKDNDIYYVADVPENKEPVFFKLISISEDGFVCENPLHDFPKIISYKREQGKLKATISGNGKSFDYLFEKKL